MKRLCSLGWLRTTVRGHHATDGRDQNEFLFPSSSLSKTSEPPEFPHAPLAAASAMLSWGKVPGQSHKPKPPRWPKSQQIYLCLPWSREDQKRVRRETKGHRKKYAWYVRKPWECWGVKISCRVGKGGGLILGREEDGGSFGAKHPSGELWALARLRRGTSERLFS